MALCGNCGAQVQDGIKFCQSCGQAVDVVQTQPVQQVPVQQPAPAQSQGQPVQQPPPVQQTTAQPTPGQAYQQQAQPVQPPQANCAQSAYQQQVYQPPVVPGAPQQADIRDAQDNKTMAWLSYILFFIPLLTGAHKTSPFVRFHANQGTVLFIASAALSIVFGILSSIITAILTASIATWGAALTIASIFGFIWLALGIVVTIFAVVGIINAVNGRMKPLPVIGKIKIIK